MISLSNISINDLLKIDKPTIIDIRNKVSYNNGHINNAINIPYEELLVNYNKYLLKDKIYYIYCSRGTKSAKLCQIMQMKGYKTINILGGYQSWILLK